MAIARTIGSRIAAARKKKGISRQAVADWCGVSVQAVGQWERDDVTNIRPENLLVLTERLEVPLAHLVRGDDIPEESELGALSQDDIDAVLARRALIAVGQKTLLDNLWGIIHAALAQHYPDLAANLGNRDLPRQRAFHDALAKASKKLRNA